jgi:protein associated with RNAse G/E
MTSNCYVIDTSSLIELNRHNPIDVFPTIWDKLKDLVDKDRLIAPREVLNEIIQNDDQLSKWAKNQKKMFKEPTPKQIEIVKDILRKYPSLINTDGKYSADPWVIALAIELATNPQKTIITIKRIVVSEEKLRGNKVKIPLICNEYKIENMDIITMFRTEGWKF